MAHAKPVSALLSEDPTSSSISSVHETRVQPEYISVVNAQRKFVEVSPSFCKLLGYTREELVGRLFDDFTVPRTTNIPIIWRLFVRNTGMIGIWVFAHRGGTK